MLNKSAIRSIDADKLALVVSRRELCSTPCHPRTPNLARGRAWHCRGAVVIPENAAGTYTVEGTAITLTPSSSADPNATTTSSPRASTLDFCIDGNTLTVRGSDGTIARLTR